MKQKLIELKAEVKAFTIIVDDFNTPFYSNGIIREKISKNIKGVRNP